MGTDAWHEEHGLMPEWTGAHPQLSDTARARVRKRFEQARAADPVTQEVTELLAQREHNAAVMDRLKVAEAYGDDDFADGTVLRFLRRWRACSDQVYTYVVVRAAGRWYTTDGVCRTWHELVAWLVSTEVPVTPADVELMRPERTLAEPPKGSTFEVL